jgi:sugar lactone lactonase YvrE
MQATLAIDARDLVGESPAWDAGQSRFLWLDQIRGVIHESRGGGTGAWHESRSWSLDRPLAGLVPRLQGGLMLGAGIDILTFDELSGKLETFVSLEHDPTEVVLNELKCDRLGRLWAGTRGADIRKRGHGALYRIDSRRNVTQVLTGVSVSNGFDWNPDGTILYYIDSASFAVTAFDYDLTQGTVKNGRSLVTFTKGTGVPDGMTVDREGCLWIAIAGTGEVRRYSPGGQLLTQILVSAPLVTSCAFGGKDGADLWVTSAALRLPDEVLETIGVDAERAAAWACAPGAGGAYVCRPGPRGGPTPPFAG